MGKKLKYGEFFSYRKNCIVNIEELYDNYSSYENDIFCPECHKAELSYIVNTDKIPHLRTKSESIHFGNCPCNYDAASTKTAKEYFTNLSSEQIRNKLNSMMRYLCTKKNKRNESCNEDIDHQPMLIETQEVKKIRNFKQLRRKSLNAFFNEDDKAQLYVFYGKIQLELEIKVEKADNGNKEYALLYFFCKNKKKFYIYFPKSQVPENIENNKEYYVVAIGEIKQKGQGFHPPFEIGLLNRNCIKYQNIDII